MMRFVKKLVFGLFFLGLFTQQTHAEFNVTHLRKNLEKQLELLQARTDSTDLTEEDVNAIETEVGEIEIALEQLEELETEAGEATYWQKIKSKATIGTIVAVTIGVAAVCAGGYFLYKGFEKYDDAVATRDAYKKERDELDNLYKGVIAELEGLKDEIQNEEAQAAIEATQARLEEATPKKKKMGFFQREREKRKQKKARRKEKRAAQKAAKANAKAKKRAAKLARKAKKRKKKSDEPEVEIDG